MRKFSFPANFQNPLSAIGLLTALIALAIGVVLLAVHFIEETHNSYFGIFLFLVVPAFLFAGLLMVPIGAWRERRRKMRGGDATPRWLTIDFNIRSHRVVAGVALVGTVIVMIFAAVVSYSAYHYSESVAFCGETCHEVMEPEHTTYKNSPHARVKCAECHIGSGADWFVKSKISGAYQLYAVARGIYPRPVPTPIENLRPARQTCEQCHWPGKVFGSTLKRFRHSLYDEANTEWPIDVLIKTGGNEPSSGEESGIHWHMNLGVEVDYVSRDRERQDIPWVKVRELATGRVSIYQDKSKPFTPEELAAAKPRRMDCVDCHNRPSHIYPSPDEAIDRTFLDDSLPRSLTMIKAHAVEAMGGDYKTRAEAMEGISNHIADAYQKEHPEIWEKDRGTVDRAIVRVQRAYKESIFPEMKANWTAYPDNLGHFLNKGCFRCHDGNHVNETGVVLSKDCRACHTILRQGAGERRQIASTAEGLEFDHPEDIGDMWRETGCWECHTGTRP
jgi:hypothetical protein